MLIECLPRESATARDVHGPVTQWGDTEHLLALIADALQAGNWQRSGGKGQRPKPFPRPGVREDGEKKYGTAMPLSEAAGFFAAWRAGVYAGGEN